MITPFDFLRSRTIWYFALIFAIYLFTGCDHFWVACTETPDEVFCQESANTDGGGKIDQTTNTTSPIGPTRKFEEKAFIKVDPNKLKYVGMKGTTPVFLANEDKSVSPNLPFRWVAYQLDLLKEKEDERSTLDMNRIGFPMAPSHDFVNSRILVSGGLFYMLDSGTKQISFVEPRSELYALAKLPDSPPYVYFRHPQVTGFAVSAKPTLMGVRSATLVHWAGPRYSLQQYNDEPVTELVMGDLDSVDPAPNGRELILLEGTKVQKILHEGVGSATPSEDMYLSFGLQQALDRNEKGSLIQGGFVANLNDDRFMDFVYARGSKVYVTSYIGRSASGIGQFVDWPNDKMPSFSIEKVKSIQAVDLTKEGYPDLVVETDQAVHFYLSIP